MSAFFSSTDNDHLKEHTETFPLLLSLIVNHNDEPVARLAFRGKTKSGPEEIEYIDFDGRKNTFRIEENSVKNIVYFYECKIDTSNFIDSYIKDKVNKIKTEKKREEKEKQKEKEKNNSLAVKEYDYIKEYTPSSYNIPSLFDNEDDLPFPTPKEHSKKELEKFLCSLITKDPFEDRPLTTILEEVGRYSPKLKKATYDIMENNFHTIYHKFFKDSGEVPRVIDDCVEILDRHYKKHPSLVDDIINVLDKIIFNYESI